MPSSQWGLDAVGRRARCEPCYRTLTRRAAGGGGGGGEGLGAGTEAEAAAALSEARAAENAEDDAAGFLA